MDKMFIVIAVLCLQLLIVFHELGHYWFARLFDMRVDRFSVGFGPKLLSFKRGETEFQLAAVPLGGYVQIVGMNPSDDIDPADPRAFVNKPMWQRFIVVLMGPVANFVLAVFCFALAFYHGVEQPDLSQPKVGMLIKGGAAEVAGLQVGDKILSVDGEPVKTFEDIPPALQKTKAEKSVLVIERAGATITVEVTPDKKSGARVIGVGPPTTLVRSSGLGRAIFDGVTVTYDKTTGLMKLLANLVTGRGQGRVMGLPGIINAIGVTAARGVAELLSLLAVLSINLGLFNILPVPALDGSRLTFLAIEGIRHKPVDLKIENMVHAVGMILLFGFMLFVSLREVFHLAF